MAVYRLCQILAMTKSLGGKERLQLTKNCLDYPGNQITRVWITEVLLYSGGQVVQFAFKQKRIQQLHIPRVNCDGLHQKLLLKSNFRDFHKNFQEVFSLFVFLHHYSQIYTAKFRIFSYQFLTMLPSVYAVYGREVQRQFALTLLYSPLQVTQGSHVDHPCLHCLP